ncbi:MAG: DUF4652 domain-containing protein [Oscillospiraceae bacterium]|nr:DUF4652 domain-containing protein [Oscillospiraceae bacterium]
MRKFYALVLIGFVLISFVACGDTAEPRVEPLPDILSDTPQFFSPSENPETAEPSVPETPEPEPLEEELDVSEQAALPTVPTALTLRIDDAGNVTESDLAGRTPIRYGSGDRKIILLADGTVSDVGVYGIIYDDDEDKIYLGERIFSVGRLTEDYYIEYSTHVSETIPAEVVVFDGVQYRFWYSGLDGAFNVTELSNFVKPERVNPWSLESIIADVELMDGVEFVADLSAQDIRIKYRDSGEIVFVCSQYSAPIANSPDKTKLAFGGWNGNTDGSTIPAYVFDIVTRETFDTGDFGMHDSNTPKRINWLDDENLLVIVGFNQGTVTRGGTLYYYNIVTGENALIVDAEQFYDKGYSVELTNAEVRGDAVVIGVCLIFDNADNWFRYTVEISLDEIIGVVGSGGVLVLECDNIG